MKKLLMAFAIATIAGPSAQEPNPADAYYRAVRADDLTSLRTLIKSGADVNVKDARGVTPLMSAAFVGSADAMRMLLDSGADPNLINNSGSTALILAASDLDKVRLLVDRGANVNIVSSRGRTAVFLAAMGGRSEALVRLLASRDANLGVIDTFKMTLLHAATIGNDTETIRFLVGKGLDVNAVNGIGFTPLVFAASAGNVEAAQLLVAKGANVNTVTAPPFQKVKAGTIALGSFTPLLMASTAAPAELITLLLDAGAHVNVSDARGMTPLMLAVATDRPNLEVIRLLLAKGVDIRATDQNGETALDWARKYESADVIDVLTRAGAPGTLSKPTPLPPFAPTDVHTAVRRSVRLLEKSTAQASAAGGCASCHHHNVLDFVSGVVSAKVVELDGKSTAHRRQLTKAPFLLSLNLLERLDPPGTPAVPLYALAALAGAGQEPDRTTDGVIAWLMAQQQNDGRWLTPLGILSRPPIESRSVSLTAIALNVMKAYGSPARGREVAERMARASKWLASADAITAEERNMQLMGVECGGADRAVLERLARRILSAQRADGGWAQKPELASDAYATGQTLFALAKTGMMSPGDPAFQRGVRYLLSTQHTDGSWFVRSRAVKFQPYFESGFPYGHDQWISAMGTGWATMALAMQQ